MGEDMNTRLLVHSCLLFVMLVFITACTQTPAQAPTDTPTEAGTTAPTQPPTVPPATLTPTKTPRPMTPTPEIVPVTVEALVGDWARVMVSNMKPEMTAHYWVRINADGTFALTTNKMQFETNVDHLGSYILDGDNIIFTAQAGSTKCEGQSATYKPVLFSNDTLEFLIVDVPCEQWLNMGAGKLGEDTIWVRLSP
jgi:hypothetical protein